MDIRKRSKPRTKKEVKKEIIKTEPAEAKVEKEKKHILFPKREPSIKVGQEYVLSDPTELVRDGKPWIPEENGYVSRIMSEEQIKILGMRGYEKVPLEAGIRFKNHPLTDVSDDGIAGRGVYTYAKQNRAAETELCGSEEIVDQLHKGIRKNNVKLNGSYLCLAPIELVQGRRNYNRNLARNMLRNALIHACVDAQKEFGYNTKRVGIFKTGKSATRASVDKVNKTTKKIWSVSAQIK